jgi:hypothetical protein
MSIPCSLKNRLLYVGSAGERPESPNAGREPRAAARRLHAVVRRGGLAQTPRRSPAAGQESSHQWTLTLSDCPVFTPSLLTAPVRLPHDAFNSSHVVNISGRLKLYRCFINDFIPKERVLRP